MIYGCIDIGSNTTRLLVAEEGEPLSQLMVRRAFTRIGASLTDDGRIPEDKIAETAATAASQARLAREAGASAVAAVATAAVRDAVNHDRLVAAVREAAGVDLVVLDSAEEARLSFLGATRTLPEPASGTIAVVDVGGGSTEIAVGAPDGAVEWWQSIRVGSGTLADEHLHSDPPASAELDVAREQVAALFAEVAPPRAGAAVAVGGTATSLYRLAGPDLDERALAGAVELLSRTPAAEVARLFDLDAQRVRLLPAGIIVLGAVCGCLGLPLSIARGGLREGVVIEMMAGASPTGS